MHKNNNLNQVLLMFCFVIYIYLISQSCTYHLVTLKECDVHNSTDEDDPPATLRFRPFQRYLETTASTASISPSQEIDEFGL